MRSALVISSSAPGRVAAASVVDIVFERTTREIGHRRLAGGWVEVEPDGPTHHQLV